MIRAKSCLFHNHKNAIQQMFDINIGCDRRAGYLYYIEHVEDMERGGVRTWLLNTFAVNHLINESHHLKRRILFEEIPSGQRFLTQIIETMRDNLTLEMTYQSFWSDTASTFEVAPYCVKVFRQRWYMVGCSMSDRRLRVYALDRIHTLRTIENTFVLPDDFDPEGFFADCSGSSSMTVSSPSGCGYASRASSDNTSARCRCTFHNWRPRSRRTLPSLNFTYVRRSISNKSC